MNEIATDIIARESRAARRLGRLFKIERTGGFDRRPAATARRLLERRGALVRELLLLDRKRRSVAAARSVEIEQVLGELAHEVRQSLLLAENRVDQLGKDLRRPRGAGLPPGIRDRAGASGRLLGRG